MKRQCLTSISRSAVLLALGARFVRAVAGPDHILKFEIDVPDPAPDLNEADATVPVAALLMWHDTLSAKLRAFNREKKAEGGRS